MASNQVKNIMLRLFYRKIRSGISKTIRFSVILVTPQLIQSILKMLWRGTRAKTRATKAHGLSGCGLRVIPALTHGQQMSAHCNTYTSMEREVHATHFILGMYCASSGGAKNNNNRYTETVWSSGRVYALRNNILKIRIKIKKRLSEVGFEPTPTFVDQNARITLYNVKDIILESGALDRSAILTWLWWEQI